MDTEGGPAEEHAQKQPGRDCGQLSSDQLSSAQLSSGQRSRKGAKDRRTRKGAVQGSLMRRTTSVQLLDLGRRGREGEQIASHGDHPAQRACAPVGGAGHAEPGLGRDRRQGRWRRRARAGGLPGGQRGPASGRRWLGDPDEDAARLACAARCAAAIPRHGRRGRPRRLAAGVAAAGVGVAAGAGAGAGAAEAAALAGGRAHVWRGAPRAACEAAGGGGAGGSDEHGAVAGGAVRSHTWMHAPIWPARCGPPQRHPRRARAPIKD